ncbi:MAG TPA: PDZ domain-containing protein, partial [Thermodesulfatator atlanticus]|nr:PDZ domain-containing protein [Thermodesulfatator atlanticus]
GEEKIILGGDVIVGIGKRPVRRVLYIVQELTRHRPGDKITLKILRQGKRLTISLTLGRLNPINFSAP